MTTEQHQILTTLYHEALALPESERSNFIAQATAGDAVLCEELSALLANAAELGEFLETNALAVTAEALAAERAVMTQGESFGRYRMQSLIGVGGMGEVWLADDTTLGRPVALKLLPPHFTQDSARITRFAQEARAASTLNHPNILTIFETGQAEDMHFIAMEYIQGQTLRALLQAGRCPVDTALDLATQIASALDAAHRAGVIHRDIKPENVMLRADGIVKVLDFGLARLTDRETETPQGSEKSLGLTADIFSYGDTDSLSHQGSSFFGTLRYLSPEQVRGESVDARADLFSLGIVFYELLAGQPPFAGNQASEVMESILTQAPAPLPADVPAPLQNIVARLLSKAPSERFSSAHELLLALRELKHKRDVTSELARERAHRRRRSYAIAGAILCALVLLGAYRWWSVRADQSFKLTDADTVLLADFDNQTGEAIFDGTLQQALTLQLAQTPFINLLSEGQKRDTLRLMGSKPNEPLTPQRARELCQRRGLKAFLRGSLMRRATQYVLTLEAVSAATGATLVSRQRVADQAESVLPALGVAVQEFRAQLGESLATQQRFNAPIEQVTTPSLNALKAYVQANEAARQGKFEEPERLYQHALALDPHFASAYAAFAQLLYDDDRFERARFYAQRAFDLRERVSEAERLRISQVYYSIVEEELDKSIEAQKLMLETYPRQLQHYISLGSLYFRTGRYELAEPAQRRAYELDQSDYRVFSNLGVTLMSLNRFEEARQIYEEALARKLDNVDIREDLYVLAEVNDDDAGMQRAIATMKGHQRESDTLNWQARTAIIRGQFQRAAELVRQELDVADREKAFTLMETIRATEASRLSAYGQCKTIPATAAQMLAKKRNQTNLSDAALWLALCGDTRQAASLLLEEDKFSPQSFRSKYLQRPVTRAVIALRRNDPAQALAELETLRPYERKSQFWAQYLRALAHQRLRHYDAAIGELRTALDHRGWSPSSKLWPLLHLELARTERLRGEGGAARKAYEAFFSLWRNADPDAPFLAEAKTEFAQLGIR